MSILNFFKKIDKLATSDLVAGRHSPTTANSEKILDVTPPTEAEFDEALLEDCPASNSDAASEDDELFEIEEPSQPVAKTKAKTSSGEANKSYLFQQSWLKQFPWLKIIDAQNKMVFCKVCNQEKMKTAWSKEKLLPTWRVDFFKYHETKDRSHVKAVENIKARPKQIIEKASDAARAKMCGQMLRCLQKVLFVVKKICQSARRPICTS